MSVVIDLRTILRCLILLCLVVAVSGTEFAVGPGTGTGSDGGGSDGSAPVAAPPPSPPAAGPSPSPPAEEGDLVDPCPFNQLEVYVNGLNQGCMYCPPGSHIEKYSSYGVDPNVRVRAECILCEPGKYRPDYNADDTKNTDTDCSFCPMNTYAAGPGSAECIQCEAGTFALTASTVCQSCLDASGNMCDFCCPAGEEFDIDCLESYTGSEPICPLDGTYIPGNMNCCSECSTGKFKKHVGSDMCVLCPPGQTLSDPNVHDQTADCADCPAEYYFDGVNLPGGSGVIETINACSKCEYGKTSKQGASQCTECPSGIYMAPPVLTPEGVVNANGDRYLVWLSLIHI